MNNNAQITAAALITAATTGFAAAGSLELDRSYAAELKADAGARTILNQTNLSNVEVEVGVRFGYSINLRDGVSPDDDETTIGFQFSEAEVAISGDVTDNMHAHISFDFGPDDTDSSGSEGTAHLSEAYVDWTVNDDFKLRVGQFVPAFSSEASTSEFHMMNSYRSTTHEFLGTPSYTQGVEASFGGDTWDLTVGFNDGPNTASTAFNSSSEADYAFNARFDFYGDSNKERFMDQTSWRGSENGWRIGAGLMYATMGQTNPSTVAEPTALFYTVDGAFEGDGWAVRGAFYGSTPDPDVTDDFNNFGFELGGSVFMSDQWELFGRWDILILDDDSTAMQTSGEDTFNYIAFGANYYFVPESHAAKLTLEIGVALDETADILNTSGDTGVGAIGSSSSVGSNGFFQDVAGEDGQVMISGVMQWLF
jgi:Phosphate-selective porin O and P